jgi:hypothetical protein
VWRGNDLSSADWTEPDTDQSREVSQGVLTSARDCIKTPQGPSAAYRNHMMSSCIASNVHNDASSTDQNPPSDLNATRLKLTRRPSTSQNSIMASFIERNQR